MNANYDAEHADAFFADLWELLGEVPVGQILRKIHRECPWGFESLALRDFNQQVGKHG